MNTTIDELIRQIENLPDHGKTDPRTALLKLREYCITALEAMTNSSASFSNERQALRSTIWVVDSIVGSESSLDRWILFVLRGKKTACANLLRKYLHREKRQLEFSY